MASRRQGKARGAFALDRLPLGQQRDGDQACRGGVAAGIEGHRHLPEIEESLSAVGSPAAGRIVFQTHSAPLVRGIFATAMVPLKRAMDRAASAC